MSTESEKRGQIGQEGTEENLWRSSAALSHALEVSGKLLRTEQVFAHSRLDTNQTKILAEARKEEAVYWESALLRAGQYREKMLEVRDVMHAAVVLIKKSTNSASLMAALFDSFPTVREFSPGRNSVYFLMSIALVREYARMDSGQRAQFLATQGAEVRLSIGDESKAMKEELGEAYYSGWSQEIAQSILTGGLQLPPMKIVAQILAK